MSRSTRSSIRSSSRLSRPRSVFFESVPNSVKRLTSFLASPENKENEEPEMFGQVPRNPDGTPQSLAPPSNAGVTPVGTRPHLSVSTPSLALKTEDYGSADLPELAPPAAPFAGGRLRRPQSSGGLSVPGASKSHNTSTPLPAEFPRTKKKRKSGGLFGKKKNEGTQMAWRLQHGSTENLEAYDVGPLLRREKVKELWYPDGDTLVYFTDRETHKAKATEPVFRIHSTPLMFTGLGDCIEDNHPVDLPHQNGQDNMAPNDLFFEVPTINAEPGISAPAAEPDTTGGAAPENEEQRPGSATTPAEQAPEVVNSHTTEEKEQEASVMYKVWFPVVELGSKPADGGKKKKSHKLSKSEAEDTLQRFIDARNLFAFFDRGFLVATQPRSMPYEIFTKIYFQLQLDKAETGDMNASSRLFMAESHLQTYMDDIKLDDVRNDDDAILEGLTMGERWRSTRLYHESFLHAVGRWEEIRHHPGWDLISQTTKSRIDRASIDLVNLRLSNIQQRIPHFDFPSVWLGSGKYAKYSGWRGGYDRMRSFTLSYYKHFYGSWPPKAGKKGKGGGYTVTGGLNRLVLKQLYSDLCCVYDLIVDREWLHGEQIHFHPGQNVGSDGEEKSDEGKDEQEDARQTLRKIQEEFNTAYMPVVPGIPFDTPKLPYRMPSESGSSKKKSKSLFRSSKSLSGDELSAILNYSYNQDALQDYGKSNQFVSQFIQMEKEWGTGKKIEDNADARRGRWIFMYCVLQSLPMTVVDGAGLRYGDGVEYFLCENVKGAAPWEKGKNNRQSRMSMFPGAEGGLFGAGLSSSNLSVNPDDEIDVTFRRSHCWEVAESWRMVMADDDDEQYYDDEYGYGGSMDGSGYLPEQQFNPNQDVPISPSLGPGYNGQNEFAAYQDPNVADDFQRIQLNQETGQYPQQPSRSNSQNYDQSGPAWAREARQSYYSQPRYSPAPSNPYDGRQSGGHERSMSAMSRQSYQSRGSQLSQPSRSSSLPTSPLERTPEQNAALPPLNELQPLQLQPFEFDLKPLEVTKSDSPMHSPTREQTMVPGQTSPQSLHRDIEASLPGQFTQSPPSMSPPSMSPQGSPKSTALRDSTTVGDGLGSPIYGGEHKPTEGAPF